MRTTVYKYHINGRYPEEEPYVIDTGELNLKRVLSVKIDHEGVPCVYVEVTDEVVPQRVVRVYTFKTNESFDDSKEYTPKVYLGTLLHKGVVLHYYYDIVELD